MGAGKYGKIRHSLGAEDKGIGNEKIDDVSEKLKKKIRRKKNGIEYLYLFSKIGVQGKSHDTRIVYTNNPTKLAEHIFGLLAGDKKKIPFRSNGDKAFYVIIDDGTRINIRYKSTSGGPAVDRMNNGIHGIKNRKIHFFNKNDKGGQR